MNFKFSVRFICAAVAISLCGCSTLRPVPLVGARSVYEAVHQGDRIRVTTIDRARIELTVTTIAETGVYGENSSGDSVLVPYEEIQRLEIRERQSAGASVAEFGRDFGVYVGAALVGLFLATAITKSE